MPEMLIVVGVVALLVSIILAPLRSVRKQAISTRCAAQLQQIGVALENTMNEYKFYPLWDDNGSPTRYTWIDVLVQRRHLTNVQTAYCPADPQPAPLNTARARMKHLVYPRSHGRPGIDYSYGIGVPLSAGGWTWRQGYELPGDGRPRYFANHERHTSGRVLAADANWSAIFNLSGDALTTQDWSYPTQYDNTVAWRHNLTSANLLYQDSHVARMTYHVGEGEASVNTAANFLWYPSEQLHVGPDDYFEDNWYPCAAPIDFSEYGGGPIPREVVPAYYTANLLWTQIYHK